MPTYTFKNRDTGEVFDKFMKIAEKDTYLKENPHLDPVLSYGGGIVHEIGTNLKVSNAFRDKIKEIKQRYRVNNIKDY